MAKYKAGIDGVIERVQKLLDMAKDTSSPNEAAIAAGRAEKLMRKHQLEHADVLVSDLDQSNVEIEIVDYYHPIYGCRYHAKTMPEWVNIISYGCGYLNDCQTGKHRGMARFYGVSGDARVAAEMFKYLVVEVTRLAKKFEGTRSEKNSFKLGASGELQGRCIALYNERKREFEATAPGTALIALKQQLVETAIGHKFNYGTSKPTKVDIAYALGQLAGTGVSLDPQIENKSHK